MPKFFAKIPFWIWPILGLICFALSVPGFLAGAEKSARKVALGNPMPELVDLQDFDVNQHVGLANEVNIFGQTHPDYKFLIDQAGGSGGAAYAIPIFSAYAAPTEKSVSHIILARDLAEVETWLSENVAGTARIGELYELNGEVVDGKGFTAAIRVTLRDAGLTQVDPLVIVKPFVAGRVAALSAPTRATYGNPFLLVAFGIWMLLFGFVVWSRMKKLKVSVSRRMGEIGDVVASKDGVNRSRLARTSKILASGSVSEVTKDAKIPLDPNATPAE